MICGKRNGFTVSGGGGLSLERYVIAMGSVQSMHSAEALAIAWEHFLERYSAGNNN